MKCTNKFFRAFAALTALCSCLTGCGNLQYDMSYNADSQVSSFNVVSRTSNDTAVPFAAGLCVVTSDILDEESVDMSQAEAAMLCDLSNKQVLYSKNAHEQLHPASLTKVMTALVALQHGSLEQKLTATNTVDITERGAQKIGLKSGDTMTLDQALRILLLYSANDVAMLIAENIAGTPEAFVEMMNQEAKRIGATNTHFANPHGLTEENHYTTAYDMYLILNEAVQYETFNEIIQMTSYETTYFDKNNKEKQVSVKTTNRFLRGDFQSPSGVTVIGGKTGTTNAAGHCLLLFSRDVTGAPYISVVLRSETSDLLYEQMIDLLDEIGK